MAFEVSQKEMIWRNYFGQEEKGVDIFNMEVTKDDFVAAHILPPTQTGGDMADNAIPLSPQSSSEKGENLEGTINEINFKIEKFVYGIGKISINNKVVDNKKWLTQKEEMLAKAKEAKNDKK